MPYLCASATSSAKWDDNKSYLTELLWGLNYLIYMQSLWSRAWYIISMQKILPVFKDLSPSVPISSKTFDARFFQVWNREGSLELFLVILYLLQHLISCTGSPVACRVLLTAVFFLRAEPGPYLSIPTGLAFGVSSIVRLNLSCPF